MKKMFLFVFGIFVCSFAVFFGTLQVEASSALEPNGLTSSELLAEEDVHIHSDGTETIIDQTYPGYFDLRSYGCSYGGKHTMIAAGVGEVYDVRTGKYTISNGFANRCSKCGMVCVSQNNPNYSWVTSLGYYTTANGPSGSVYYLIKVDWNLSYNSKLGGDDFTKSINWMDRHV